MREDAGQVEVCVAITSRHSYCPVAYDFSLVLVNIEGSASKISILFSVSYANVSVLGGNGEDQLLSGSCSSVPSVLDLQSPEFDSKQKFVLSLSLLTYVYLPFFILPSAM